MSTLLLLAGSRSCALHHERAAWAREQVAVAVAGLGRGDVVLTGGADGPDAWAREAALAAAGDRRPQVVEFRLDGQRWVDGLATARTWVDLVAPGTAGLAWPLRRDTALAAAAAKARGAGWRAYAVGLTDPRSPTRGAAHAVAAAAAAGVAGLDLAYPALLTDHRGFLPWVPDRAAQDPDEALWPELAAALARWRDDRAGARAAFQPGDLVWVDTETTGLHRDCAMIEVGVVRTDGAGAGLRAAWEARVPIPPGARVKAAALAVNGYTPAAWRDAVPLPVALATLADFLWGLPVLAAHNAPFDRGVLAREFARAEAVMPRLHPRALDTRRLAEAQLGARVPNRRLATVAGHLGVGGGPAHRALADAYRALRVYRALVAAARDDPAARAP